MQRLVPRLTALLCAAVLAGCGGGEETPPEPALPSGVASDLAAKSDAVADAYAQGDVCGAAQRADDLRADVIAAIQGGDVPGPFQESLMATANELVNEINCPEAPPAEEEEEQEDQTSCDELVAERDALVEQREEKESKGNGNGKGDGSGKATEKLDERIAALEEQIQACQEGEGGEGDGEEDD